MKYKRYRGIKPWQIWRTIYRTLCGVGFLVVLGSAAWSDSGAPLGRCTIAGVIGLVMFALFGWLGDLIV